MAELPKRIVLKPSTQVITEFDSAKTEGTKEEPVLLSLSPLFEMKGKVKTILKDGEGNEIAALLKCHPSIGDIATLKLQLVEKISKKDGKLYTFYIVGNSAGECEVIAV